MRTLASGLRTGEVTGLTCHGVDVEVGVLAIAQSRLHGPDGAPHTLKMCPTSSPARLPAPAGGLGAVYRHPVRKVIDVGYAPLDATGAKQTPYTAPASP